MTGKEFHDFLKNLLGDRYIRVSKERLTPPNAYEVKFIPKKKKDEKTDI
jgi:hypothetical protein